MLKIVDGLREKPHVTSNDHFGRNEGIVGISDYVLNAGRMFETELISSNELRIYDGEGMIQGCHWRILPGTYETVKLSNGTQGKKRIDYVVARYEKNSVGYEDIGISVKEGEATSGNPKPPAYITGDIRTGDTIREMVLAEIEYEGINVVEVTPKFKVLMTMAELQEKTDELNRKLPELVVASSSTISYTPDRDCKVLVTYEVCGWGFGGTTWQIEITGSASSGDSPIRADMKRGVFDGTDGIYKDVSTSAYFIGLRAGVTYTFNRVSYAGSGGKEANPFMKLLAV